jgi:hypothetical protein
MIQIEINRPNGQIEMIDISNKFGNMNSDLLDKIRQATKDAGKGVVVKAIITTTKSNMQKLMREYNNLHNEGGDGYIPDGTYFQKLESYKEWTETKEIK